MGRLVQYVDGLSCEFGTDSREPVRKSYGFRRLCELSNQDEQWALLCVARELQHCLLGKILWRRITYLNLLHRPL